MLKYEADAPFAHMGESGVLTGKQHRAAVRVFKPGDDPQQGGLAAPGRPQQRHQLAAVESQRDIVQRLEVTKGFPQITDLNAHETS